jgi:DNA polymerase-1
MIAAFREVWAADFEFVAHVGERSDPVCLVAKELRKVLGWPMPARILDLYVEFRNHTNGLSTLAGSGLLGALTHFGRDAICAAEKHDMRQVILRGGPWDAAERAAILDYCENDVVALERLLPVMLPGIDMPRALLRGRYMAAVAAIEQAGIPIDVATLSRLRANWHHLQDKRIAEFDADYGVFEGRTFKLERFEGYLARHGIAWPRLASGQLDLCDRYAICGTILAECD